MSSDDSSNAPAKRDAREAVREKAQQVHARQSRSRLIQRALLVIGAVAVIGLVVGSVVWVVGSNISKPQVSPSNVNDDGFIVSEITGVDASGGSADDAVPAPTETPAADEAAETTTATASPAVEIRVYVDYLSEGSRTFQIANVPQLSTWIDQGAATLTYYPVAMLSAKSNGTKYSLRAASAAACVATHSPETFFAYSNELLVKQPAVDSDGMSDAELADLAQASGVDSPKVVRACIEEERFASWARDATDRALAGIPDTGGLTLTATPTVLVNGQAYVGALDDAAEFSQFVLTIASDAYYKSTATPTPTPSATPTNTP